jgi:hypothetical protein
MTMKLINLFAIVVLFFLILATVPASMAAPASHTPSTKVIADPAKLSGLAQHTPRLAGLAACSVLVVDDDWDFDQTVPNDGGRPYYSSALDALGYAYDVWDTVTLGQPTTADMQSYGVVLWFTGFAWTNGVFTPDNETEVAAYLNGGGSLILSSQEYHFETGTITSFMANYLGVADVTNDVIELDPVGNAGNPIGNGLGPYAMVRPDDWAAYWPTGSDAGPYDDYVNATPGASEPFRFSGSNQNNSTNMEGAGWKTAFFAWPLEWIDTVSQRAEILGAVLDWMCGDGVPQVQLLPSFQQGSAEPGNTAFYLVDIENLLGHDETFDLAYDSIWPATGQAQIGPVANGGSDQFLVQVAVPANAHCTAQGMLTVTASDPSDVYSDTAQILTFAAGDWDTVPNYGASGAYWMAYACTDDYGSLGTCFYAGGLGAGNVVTGTAQTYDIATQTWTAIASLPTPVFGAVGGYLGGRFCVAGGFTTTTGDWGGTYATQCYNPGTNAWAAAADIPGTAGGAGGAVGGVTGGMLHVVAGCGTNACRSGQHFAFDGTNWTQLAAMPDDLIFPGAAVGQDKLFVGGDQSGMNAFYEYDTGANSWLNRADLPVGAGKKSPVGVVVPGGGVFWWGGDLGNGSSVQDTTWYYDPTMNRWEQFPATLVQATTGAGGGMANNTLWSFGGSTGAGPLSPPPHEFLVGWCVPESYHIYLPIVVRTY